MLGAEGSAVNRASEGDAVDRVGLDEVAECAEYMCPTTHPDSTLRQLATLNLWAVSPRCIEVCTTLRVEARSCSKFYSEHNGFNRHRHQGLSISSGVQRPAALQAWCISRSNRHTPLPIMGMG